MKQPTLFETNEFLKKPGVVLDIKQARAARDRGINSAVQHAVEENKTWKEQAFKILIDFLKHHPGPFLAEQVRQHALRFDGYVPPPHDRAWGSVLVMARKRNLIIQAGYAKVKNKKAHRANASLWKQKTPLKCH